MYLLELIKDYSSLVLIIAIFGYLIYTRHNMQLREKDMLRTRELQTGLLNERAFIDALNSLTVKHQMLDYSLVYFDIVRFGLINERYGMDVGNILLKEYARWLEKIVDGDEILSRQTGDRFIAAIKKDRLGGFLGEIKSHEFDIDHDKRTYRISVSARSGVYSVDKDEIPGEEMISIAHAALNYGKTVVKKDVTFMTEKLSMEIKERKRLENDIPLAMANDEFKIYYQPKVDITNMRLCGAEALVRWHRGNEIIYPGKFIPLLEQNDLMCDMDFYMLRHLCADLSKWIVKGIVPPTVSINFSRRNFSNENAADAIDEIVREYHVPKKMIEIEITETIDEFPISVLKSFVDRLHRLGYRVAVDDFGSGSSSLSLLREVTFDTLKIDKGFVDRAYAKDLTILSYIIKMAKALNVDVLAEGVERKEQLETLKSLGCEVIQGYYFDKALSKKGFEERILIGGYMNE